MNHFTIIFLLSFSAFLLNSCSQRKFYNGHSELQFQSTRQGASSELTGKVLIYVGFVSTGSDGEWTDYAIESTMDSLRRACKWLEVKAENYGIQLSIQLVPKTRGNRPEIHYSRLIRGTVEETYFSNNGLRRMNQWSDKISRSILTNDLKEGFSNSQGSDPRLQLVESLKAQYEVANVSLLFMVNKHATGDISRAFNTQAAEEIEFAVITTKRASTMAHCIMELYGATDITVSRRYVSRKVFKCHRALLSDSPNAIMAYPYRSLEKADVSAMTAYLVGWQSTLSKKYSPVISYSQRALAEY